MPTGGVPFQERTQTAFADHPVSRDGEQDREVNPGYGVAKRTLSSGLIGDVNEQSERDTQQQARQAYHADGLCRRPRPPAGRHPRQVRENRYPACALDRDSGGRRVRRMGDLKVCGEDQQAKKGEGPYDQRHTCQKPGR